jgi:hypothetical protein
MVDIVKLVEAAEAKSSKRGPYKKRAAYMARNAALTAAPNASLIAALLCLPLLAGCTKPVTYYAEHAAERKARVHACLETPENDNQDCRNAAQAEFDALGIKAVNGRAVPISNSN